jgi:hypothetical protein
MSLVRGTKGEKGNTVEEKRRPAAGSIASQKDTSNPYLCMICYHEDIIHVLYFGLEGSINGRRLQRKATTRRDNRAKITNYTVNRARLAVGSFWRATTT